MGFGNDWQDFGLVCPKNPITDLNWVDADVDGITIVVESDIGGVGLKDSPLPNANGASTGWTDATDGGAATYSDFGAVRTMTWYLLQWLGKKREDVDPSVDWPNGIKTSTADAAQSFTVATPTVTFDSVTSVTLKFYLVRSGTPPTARIECFFRPTSGSTANESVMQTRTVDSTLADATTLTGYYSFEAYAATNPYTAGAWTQAQILAGEFGVRYKGGGEVTIGAVSVEIAGLGPSANATIRLDSLQLDVVGANADEATDLGIIGKTRLWSTSKAHLRYTSPQSIEDVTNSVAVTTPGTMPLDWTILYGQVYLVNGQDKTRRYPTSADVFEALTNNGANYITGRTVAAFANRILYGWVNDNGTITPERVAYSKIYDGGDHNHASAGDFDLIDTPGGVVKLATISEDCCAAYKEEGVYALRKTGNSVAPILVDVIDRQTGCLAGMTVKTLVDSKGTPYQLFLGHNPSNGINVYYSDCTQVQPVWGIHKALRDRLNMQAVGRAFAEVEPQEGLYWLFVPRDDEEVPEGGYIYHVRSGQWTEFTLPYPVTCAGQWTMDYRYETAASGVPGWKKSLVVGTLDSLPKVLDYDITHDEYYPHSEDLSALSDKAYGPWPNSSLTQGMFSEPITSTVETGDYRLAEGDAPHLQAILTRIHIIYEDQGPCTLGVSVSTDGGKTYGTEETYNIGSPDPDNWEGQLYNVLDIAPVTGRRHRVKFNFTPYTTGQLGERFKLEELWLEFEPAPENP